MNRADAGTTPQQAWSNLVATACCTAQFDRSMWTASFHHRLQQVAYILGFIKRHATIALSRTSTGILLPSPLSHLQLCCCQPWRYSMRFLACRQRSSSINYLLPNTQMMKLRYRTQKSRSMSKHAMVLISPYRLPLVSLFKRCTEYRSESASMVIAGLAGLSSQPIICILLLKR